MDDWLPKDHLARFVVDIVDQLDLSALTGQQRGTGSAAYHPTVMLGLLIYGYATGVYSSRRIEAATFVYAPQGLDRRVAAQRGFEALDIEDDAIVGIFIGALPRLLTMQQVGQLFTLIEETACKTCALSSTRAASKARMSKAQLRCRCWRRNPARTPKDQS